MSNWIKSVFITATIAVVSCQQIKAQEVKDGLTWYTDINKAHEVSVKTKKPVFAFFTGSDWCIWCHRLEAAVFSKPGFKTWAKENVILLEVDFPRKTQLPEALAQQNQGLQQFFQVQGYPSIWMFYINKDKTTGKYNITALGNLGYPQAAQGKEEAAFLDNANKILKNKAS